MSMQMYDISRHAYSFVETNTAVFVVYYIF